MAEGTWAVEAYPRGLTGVAVFSPNSFRGWGISQKSKSQGTAVHFLTFLSNADNNTHYAKTCGALPIHGEAAQLEESLAEGDLAQEIAMAGRQDWYAYALAPTMYQAYGDYRELLDGKLRQLLSGDLSQQELLAFLDGYWSDAYEAEGALWK